MPGPIAGELDAERLHLVSTVLAVACGLTAANLYYAQPLLDLLARTFGVSEGSAAVVVTATQLGYAAGMIVLLPLGDLLENRTLAGRMLVCTAAALVAAGVAPTFGLFLVASVAVGMTSSVTQILVPVAARLAPPGPAAVHRPGDERIAARHPPGPDGLQPPGRRHRLAQRLPDLGRRDAGAGAVPADRPPATAPRPRHHLPR